MPEVTGRDHIPVIPAGGAYPLPGALPVEDAEQQLAAAETDVASVLPRVSRAWIFFLVIANFGTALAFITPLAISLSIQLNRIAPGNEGFLGVVLGIGALSSLITGPISGQFSDRTRSRLGRRRPWIIAGTIVGVIGLAVLGLSAALWALILGWVIAQIGFNFVLANIVALQSDKLPEEQRARVAGLTGVSGMIASVIGVSVAGLLAATPLVMFLLPGAIAVVMVLPIVLFAREADSRTIPLGPALTIGGVLAKYVYNPRKHPDFSWNWLGRFFFYSGLTFSSTYTAFFFAARLNIEIADVGGVVAIASLIGLVATIAGSLFSGFLSDKIRRRKPFVFGAGILFAAGAIITAFGPDLTVLIIGVFITNIGVGVFSAVDQALLLDVIPDRDTDAARFISITQFSIGIPQALVPVAASAILAANIASTAGPGANYVVLYLISAVLVIIGGLVVLRVRSVR